MTDKATVMITVPFDGVITELRCKEGDVVPVESVIAVIETAGGGAHRLLLTEAPVPREPRGQRPAAPPTAVIAARRIPAAAAVAVARQPHPRPSRFEQASARQGARGPRDAPPRARDGRRPPPGHPAPDRAAASPTMTSHSSSPP